MRFEPLQVCGAFVITPDEKSDERGFFARVFCEREFAAQKLESRFVQINHSKSVAKGTLRGMHYQLSPAEEVKLVKCVSGELYDVVLDLRPESKTYGQWDSAVLTAQNRKMVYVPKGCAHGFITLIENTEIVYLVSEFYSSSLERGVRWNDPNFKIEWPLIPTVLSERDRSHADYVMEVRK